MGEQTRKEITKIKFAQELNERTWIWDCRGIVVVIVMVVVFVALVVVLWNVAGPADERRAQRALAIIARTLKSKDWRRAQRALAIFSNIP